MKKSISITICGDICPTKDTLKYFESEDNLGLFNNCRPLFEKSDILLGNLEFPLIDEGRDIKKAGPVLKGPRKFINIFKKAGFDVLSMANNHIKDCGEEGVLSTLQTCKNNNIKTVGAGKDIKASKEPLIIEKNGYKVGIFAFAEHEFNAAYENKAGANLLDLYVDFDVINALKKEVDYLIVLYHGGVEYYKYPSPLLQKKCRKMIESGADLVTCQHSHCIGTVENYGLGSIVYGQGNTVFGFRKNNAAWNEGLLLKIELSGKESKIDYIPIETSMNGSVNLMEKERGIERLEELKLDSKLIKDPLFIKNAWENFCEEKKSLYLPQFLGLSRIQIHVNRLLNNRLIKTFYADRKLKTSLNIIRCEAHLEVINTILEKEK